MATVAHRHTFKRKPGARSSQSPPPQGEHLAAFEARPRTLFGNQLRWAKAVIADWLAEYRSS